MSPNAEAFLAMLRHSEGTDRAPDPYRVTFGFHYTIQSLSDHPTLTGEWLGESLAFLGPKYANSISTAAGAYQIIKGTWISHRMRLRFPDFGKASQDACALAILEEDHALQFVEAGALEKAIELCCGTWASLAGSQAGQPTRSVAWLSQAFTDAGGTPA